MVFISLPLQLVNCSYNWTNIWAEIDTIDVNQKQTNMKTIKLISVIVLTTMVLGFNARYQ